MQYLKVISFETSQCLLAETSTSENSSASTSTYSGRNSTNLVKKRNNASAGVQNIP